MRCTSGLNVVDEILREAHVPGSDVVCVVNWQRSDAGSLNVGSTCVTLSDSPHAMMSLRCSIMSRGNQEQAEPRTLGLEIADGGVELIAYLCPKELATA